MGDGPEVLVGRPFAAPEMTAMGIGFVLLGGKEILHEPEDDHFAQLEIRLAGQQDLIARNYGEYALAV